MTTFVLVHGAWHGPWAWDRLTPFLHQAGARTITPALTLNGDIGLHAHVQEVLTALDAVADDTLADDLRDDLVLVGHSYAGVASGVNNAVARTGGLLAVAAIPPLAGLTGDAFHDPASFTTGFHTTMLVSAAMMVVAALIALLTIRENVLADSHPQMCCPVEAPQQGR